MKAVVAVLVLLVGLSMATLGAGSIKDVDFEKNLHQVSSPESGSFQDKISGALKDVTPAKVRGSSEDATEKALRTISDNSSKGTSTNQSAQNVTSGNITSLNSTSLNQTSLNQTSLNPSPQNSSDPSGAITAGNLATISDSTSASPGALGSETSGSFDGYWGIQASKGGFGKPTIKSRTMLKGGFEVEKTVKFTE